MHDQDLILEGGNPADAGTDEHAATERISGHGAGLLEGHVGSRYGELGAPVAPSDLLRVLEVGGRIEVVDPPVTHRCVSTEAVPERVGAYAT